MKGHVVRVGDKWGTLECTHSGRIVFGEKALDENGKEYIANSWTVNGHVFKCVCGNEVQIEAKKFRGKRVMKDCGCGRASKGNRIVIAFSTDTWMQQRLQDISNMDQQTVSYTINTALREYFERRELGKIIDEKTLMVGAIEADTETDETNDWEGTHA